MRNFDEMKSMVLEIVSNEHEVPEGIDMDSFIDDMLHYMGDTDSEMREGVFECIAVWAESDDGLSNEQLRRIAFACLDEKHMFFGLGETETDTVFTRSFSALALYACIGEYSHEDNPFLSEAEAAEILAKVMQYVDGERDYRGYVKDKGWAHAIAHIADVLNNLAFCAKRDGIVQILSAVAKLASNKEVVYTALEDERLANAAVGLLYAGCYEGDYFTIDEFCNWIKESLVMVERETMPDDNNINANRKAFIKSLYVKVITDTDLPEDEAAYKQVCECLLEILTELYED